LARVVVHEEVLPAPPAEVFPLLHTPSAIRLWWGASRAVVLPREGGAWAASWGRSEDRPDYQSTGMIAAFEPPNLLRLKPWRTHGAFGGAPFDDPMALEFTLEEHPRGTLLRVLQEGIPDDRRADDFHAACLAGWAETLAGLRSHLEAREADTGQPSGT
jgi:uncharacterized protein YndB with AHSA1/START domain